MLKEKIPEFISYFITALSNCALYSKTHPIVGEFSEKAVRIMEELCEDGSLGITLLGDSLLFNNEPFIERRSYTNKFIKMLKKRGIERIAVAKGVDPGEFRSMVAFIASGEEFVSTPHLSVGTVEVRLKNPEGDAVAVMGENISKVREVYRGVSRFKRLDMCGLEDAVASFISVLKKEVNVLKMLSTVGSYKDLTCVHASNVALLTIFQAEALGMSGDILFDVGSAGLLHDVGKMFVPREVLEKRAGLSKNEWNEIRKHPVEGAMYLSNLPEVPKISLIAVFEHHMKFDGSGYPSTKRPWEKQHLVSQMVSIADFYDALRTEKPYRKALDADTVAGLLVKTSGTDFNPDLVDNFLNALKRINAINL
jgi:response regulator RpfG family c-di-GMP phosphodiesterase